MRDDTTPQDEGQDPSIAERSRRATGAAMSAAATGATIAGRKAADASAFAAGEIRKRAKKEVPPAHRPALLDHTGESEAVPEVLGNVAAYAVVSAQLLLADFLASREESEDRRERMERVVAKQASAVAEIGFDASEAASVLSLHGEGLSPEERIGFAVDLDFLDPFAPYTLKMTKATHREGLTRVVVLLGDDNDLVERIGVTRKSAMAAHTKRSLGRVGFIGIGAAVMLGVVGILAAPVAGAALGAAAGLSGAAAVSHGLALLGGGALAAGGAGMAGGMWVVAGTAAAAGLVAAGGGTALYELGSATARGELVKLQITFKLGLLDANRDMAKAQQVITNLMDQASETRTLLEEERILNEDNARRVKDLEQTLAAIEETISWMQDEKKAAVDG